MILSKRIFISDSLQETWRTWAWQIIYFSRSVAGQTEGELKTLHKEFLYRHVAFLYALKSNVRKSAEKPCATFLAESELAAIEKQSNKHNAIINLQTEKLTRLYHQGTIDGFQFLELNKMIIGFCD